MRDTREKLIESAKKFFYREGFRNTGIDAILAEVGISKTAFYKHFESKDALMVAVLDTIDAFLQQEFRRMVKDRGGPSARGQLRAVLDIVRDILDQGDFHGCIFVAASMEFPLAHDPVHEAALRHKRAIEEFIYELAERAGAADPAALSQELCLVIEGAYVSRSLTSDPKTIEIARRLADSIFERGLPATVAPRDGSSKE